MKCVACKGRGHHDSGLFMETCVICGGTGEVTSDTPAYEPISDDGALVRHKYAIQKNDKLNWLNNNLDVLTDTERERYWSAVRTILSAEIEIKELYEAAKGRVKR